MQNNGVDVYYKETTTNLQVQKGWNYIAMHVDEIYEYSYVAMYHRSELDLNNILLKNYNKYETFFKGFYKGGFAGFNDNLLILGCKTYQSWDPTSYGAGLGTGW